jgi:hypothetical protein
VRSFSSFPPILSLLEDTTLTSDAEAQHLMEHSHPSSAHRTDPSPQVSVPTLQTVLQMGTGEGTRLCRLLASARPSWRCQPSTRLWTLRKGSSWIWGISNHPSGCSETSPHLRNVKFDRPSRQRAGSASSFRKLEKKDRCVSKGFFSSVLWFSPCYALIMMSGLLLSY